MIAVDLFAGAGGCSTGLMAAAAKRGLHVNLTAVNHWPLAIETHAVNHPNAAHFCAAVEALVQPVLHGRTLDIRFRMLQPHELAAAMSFPAGYRFIGNKGEVTKQIGNAVVCVVAEALCGDILDSARQSASVLAEGVA